MTENPATVSGAATPADPEMRAAALRKEINTAGITETAIQVPLSIAIVDAAGFFNRPQTVAGIFGPKGNDPDPVKQEKEQEIAMLMSLLGDNAHYLTTPFTTLEGELAHNAAGPDNDYGKTPYTIQVRLGTTVPSVYYHLWAQPADGVSGFSYASRVLVTQLVSNRK